MTNGYKTIIFHTVPHSSSRPSGCTKLSLRWIYCPILPWTFFAWCICFSLQIRFVILTGPYIFNSIHSPEFSVLKKPILTYIMVFAQIHLLSLLTFPTVHHPTNMRVYTWCYMVQKQTFAYNKPNEKPQGYPRCVTSKIWSNILTIHSYSSKVEQHINDNDKVGGCFSKRTCLNKKSFKQFLCVFFFLVLFASFFLNEYGGYFQWKTLTYTQRINFLIFFLNFVKSK